MPTWAKHAIFILIGLILLARWRSVGSWLAGLLESIGDLFQESFFGYHDAVYRFAVFGVLVVACVALWAVYWREKSRREK